MELTESLFLKDIDAGIEILRQMKALGIHVPIDDFGTGFSSLSYLKRLPVDKLKIDQSFVRDLENDPGDAAIVSAIITLAHNLGLEVIAEGVETEGQSNILSRYRCDEAQGYFFMFMALCFKVKTCLYLYTILFSCFTPLAMRIDS